jgi:hypothetical protein
LPVLAIVGLIGMIPMFGDHPRRAVTHECWVPSGPNQFRVLDWVDNLETCGARLEVLFLRGGKPVSGAYGGVFVYVDADSIEAAADHQPRTTLLAGQTRRDPDAAIRTLIARGSGGGDS